MRGHDHIIAMRRSGKKPSMVFVNDYPCRTDWFEHGDSVTVCTSGEVVQLLDLRFLIGLRVSISSPSEIRAKALFDQAKLAGAGVVAAVHLQDGVHTFDQSGWCQIWHKEAVHG